MKIKDLKLRAWLIKEKRMIDVSQIDFNTEYVVGNYGIDVFFGNGDDVELLPAIGHSDRDFTPIYKGDILHHWRNPSMEIIAGDTGLSLLINYNDYIVVGNKYEHQERINKKNKE